MSVEKHIGHVDMDAFFAAIEQRDNPHLKGKPVVIGADPKKGKGRGVVSTCSYEARRFGIHSAMPISMAYRKCPEAVFLPVDGKKYVKVSYEIYDILYDFTPVIEPISIDEAFLDITGSYRLFGTPLKTCILIKAKIKKETDLTASIGLAPTKMVAKIASDLKKPNGLVVVSKDKLLDFLWPLDISKLWGLGKKSESALRSLRINTIGDLARMNIWNLVDIFGKNGVHFWNLANGVDDRAVETETETKSVGNETTFSKDINNEREIKSELMFLCEKVSDRLRRYGFKARTVTLKIRLENFKTHTRGSTLDEATNFTDVLYKKIKELYNRFDKKGKKIRLVGVKTSNLSSIDSRDSLFEEKSDKKKEDIHKAVDKIRERFGDLSIHRATSSK